MRSRRVPASRPAGGRSATTRSAEQAHTDRIIFAEHVAAFVMLNGLLAWLKLTSWPAAPWGWWVPLGWGAALALHGLYALGRLPR